MHPLLQQIGLDAIHFSIHNIKDNTPVYNEVNEEKIKSILHALEFFRFTAYLWMIISLCTQCKQNSPKV